MSVLFKDELYKSETVEILTQYISDAQLIGGHQVPYIKQIYYWVLARGSATFWILKQVIVGDQLTCKNIRGCKVWRQAELDLKDRLTWAHEVPGTKQIKNLNCKWTVYVTINSITSQVIFTSFGNAFGSYSSYFGVRQFKLGHCAICVST